VLERTLAECPFAAGDDYTIADMAVWLWYGQLLLNVVYEAAEFLGAESYTHAMRWAKIIEARPAVKRGRTVNKLRGPLHQQLRERHAASDLETRTQDRLEAAD